MWTASHLLLKDETVALPVLEELSRGKGFVAFDAEMVIKQWRAGKLRF
jgi:hypothetical protein